MRFAQLAVRVFGCQMDFQHPENTAREGIRQLKDWIHALGLPATLQEVGGRPEDIPDILVHRAKKPAAFPIGKFRPLQESDMAIILELTTR